MIFIFVDQKTPRNTCASCVKCLLSDVNLVRYYLNCLAKIFISSTEYFKYGLLISNYFICGFCKTYWQLAALSVLQEGSRFVLLRLSDFLAYFELVQNYDR